MSSGGTGLQRGRSGRPGVINRAKQSQFSPFPAQKRRSPEKQTQSKPIAAGVLIQPLALSAAPAQSNGAVERIKLRRLNSQISDLKSETPGPRPVIIRAKQSQFPQPDYGPKAIVHKQLPQHEPSNPGPKQTQTKPISGCSLIYSPPHLAYHCPCRAARQPAGRTPRTIQKPTRQRSR